MIYKKIRFGLFFVWLSVALLSASVKEEFDKKLATDQYGYGLNLIFTKPEIEKAFGQEGFWGRSDQKESTFLHQALLLADENVRAVVVDKILNVRDLDLEELLKFKDAQGRTALFLAVKNNDQVSVDRFLKKEKKINANKGTFDLALNSISIADNQGLTPLEIAEKNKDILEIFKNHINDQNIKYNSFIGSGMLQQIDQYLVALKKPEPKEKPQEPEHVKKEEEKGKYASMVIEKESNLPAPKEEKAKPTKEKEASQKTEVKKDEELKKSEQLKEGAPQDPKDDEENKDQVDKDVTGDKADDLVDDGSKDTTTPLPGTTQESSLIKPVGISLLALVSLAAVYTGYEWYDDYSELLEKNKELEDPLTDAELRALAWKKTKKRFFEFFE
jgi:ankyrin repeat protein